MMCIVMLAAAPAAPRNVSPAFSTGTSTSIEIPAPMLTAERKQFAPDDAFAATSANNAAVTAALVELVKRTRPFFRTLVAGVVGIANRTPTALGSCWGSKSWLIVVVMVSMPAIKKKGFKVNESLLKPSNGGALGALRGESVFHRAKC